MLHCPVNPNEYPNYMNHISLHSIKDLRVDGLSSGASVILPFSSMAGHKVFVPCW